MASSGPSVSTCAHRSPASVRRLSLVAGLALGLLCPVQGATMEPSCAPDDAPASVSTAKTLRVTTLNLAHGRRDRANQMLLSAATIREHIIDAGRAFGVIAADVVALQEADGPSLWSGRFDHVALLAREAGYPCILHGIHARNRMFQFGTALLSRQPFGDTLVHGFEPSRPTLTKGFVLGSLAWNPDGRLGRPLRLQLVSVHLDFSRRSVRRTQVDEMIAVLEAREDPIALMGDFNSDWNDNESELKRLAERLDLHAYQPRAENLATYAEGGARLDWILLSRNLGFLNYTVYPEVLSDHRAVGAEIEWTGNACRTTC